MSAQLVHEAPNPTVTWLAGQGTGKGPPLGLHCGSPSLISVAMDVVLTRVIRSGIKGLPSSAIV